MTTEELLIDMCATIDDMSRRLRESVRPWRVEHGWIPDAQGADMTENPQKPQDGQEDENTLRPGETTEQRDKRVRDAKEKRDAQNK